MIERHFSCVRCLIEGRPRVPATGMDGMNSVCVDHEAAGLHLCRACRYWVATVGPLCEMCANQRSQQTEQPEHR